MYNIWGCWRVGWQAAGGGQCSACCELRAACGVRRALYNAPLRANWIKQLFEYMSIKTQYLIGKMPY